MTTSDAMARLAIRDSVDRLMDTNPQAWAALAMAAEIPDMVVNVAVGPVLREAALAQQQADGTLDMHNMVREVVQSMTGGGPR